MTAAETLRVTRFLKQAGSAFENEFSGSDPQQRVVLYLIESHLQNRPVTISSLAAESMLPHATALRRINAMIACGDIEQRAKAQGKKTYFLVPSASLLRKFDEYAATVKNLIAETVGVSGEFLRDFYFGAGNFSRDLIPPRQLVDKIKKSGSSLRFMVNNDNFFSAMRNMWSDYRSQLGSPTDFTLVSLGDLHGRVRAELERPAGRYEIVAIDMPWIGEFSAANLLRPLDDLPGAESMNAAGVDARIWSTGSWSKKQYGVPVYTTVEVLAARTDLFQSQNLPYPRTFDETVETASKLHRPLNGVFGVGWNGAAGLPIASTFMIFLGSCGAPLLNYPLGRSIYDWSTIKGEALRPNLLSDQAFQTLDFMHRLLPYSPPEVLEADWDDQLHLLMNGNLAMSFCWSMRAALVTNAPSSKVRHKIEFLPQPKGPGGISANPIGGFHLGIPRNISDERARLAFEAISWLVRSDDPSAKRIPLSPYFSHAVDPELISGSKIFQFTESLAQKGMLCNSQRPALPEYRLIEAALGSKIHAALAGDLSDREALSQAQRCIDDVMRSNGRY